MVTTPPEGTLRHARKQPRRRALRIVACAVAGAVLFVGTGAAALYHELSGNISSDYSIGDFRSPQPTVDDTATTPDASPSPTPSDPRAGEDYNVLLIGSDTRDGDNFDGTDIEGARADTTILVHIPADRSRVEAVSIPRDLLTEIPPCTVDEAGTMSYEQSNTMFNAAFSTGSQNGDVGLGAICTALTVERLTGVEVDDFAVVDFAGFRRMVNTIGGVPMCIPERLYNADAAIDLQPGFQTLDGDQALGFARMRKGRDDGSDINRIGHQQELLAAIVRHVESKNLVTDSLQLIQFLDALTSSLTTSSGLNSPFQLAGLAMAVAPIGAQGVTFVTMPIDYAGNRVVSNDLSELMWERLRNDVPLNSAQEAADDGEAPAGGEDADTGAPVDPGTATDPATEPDEGTDDGADATPEPTDPWEIKTGATEVTC